MNTTRRTLLNRVRDLGDRDAWDQFYGIYAPVIYRFARRQGLTEDDAEEIRDQCLELLSRKMPEFVYDPRTGKFKAWLYRVVRGRIIDMRRRKVMRTVADEELEAVVAPQPSPTEAWESLWRMEHLRYCMDKASLKVSSRDARAFSMLLVDENSVAQVCEALAMNANQVYKAKVKVLQAVREILRELGE